MQGKQYFPVIIDTSYAVHFAIAAEAAAKGQSAGQNVKGTI
jgi:hypothetical protein